MSTSLLLRTAQTAGVDGVEYATGPRAVVTRKSSIAFLFIWSRPPYDSEPEDWDAEDWELMTPPDLESWWPEAAKEE